MPEVVFPDAEVCGCFFHLKKSIWRHILSDVFVPSDLVIGAFVLLQQNVTSKLSKLYKYFEEIYIGVKGRERYGNRKEPRYSILLWNCYQRTQLACRCEFNIIPLLYYFSELKFCAINFNPKLPKL
ncbi:hypothetical protein BpHYR1_047432 [Brachionus plicatilis]|uniref:MULE transposase domain-containing protein n=1 Tax=Brachionus plicatilis TaxID=10195 RepID=A0A3M7PCS1_BRAPC|nr:hypothetical protein BpHYR1_047432 [Brachionus plicatilis]